VLLPPLSSEFLRLLLRLRLRVCDNVKHEGVFTSILVLLNFFLSICCPAYLSVVVIFVVSCRGDVFRVLTVDSRVSLSVGGVGS
jgi:hypothetical protein